jgi:hypothetical protein
MRYHAGELRPVSQQGFQSGGLRSRRNREFFRPKGSNVDTLPFFRIQFRSLSFPVRFKGAPTQVANPSRLVAT